MIAMNSRLVTTVAVVGALSLLAATANAADVIEEPPVYIPPAPVEEVSTAGWYLRGDVGYVFESETSGKYGYLRGGYGGGDFVQYYHYDNIETDSAFMVGGGLGYRFNAFARMDLTADYFTADVTGSSNCVDVPSAYCSYADSSEIDVWTVMANAYVDLGTYGRFTPYVGGGAGVANVSYGTMNNKFECNGGFTATNCGETFTHEGMSEWRFAYSLMAGASIDITQNLKFDAGYKYTRIAEGEAFGWDAQDIANGASGVQGYDHGYDLHAVRAGLRYEFGGGGFGKGKGKAPVYAPDPVYAQDVVFK
ncbi:MULTISPECIES: outer membrane protein [unclassified Aurantimonas]|uniref:outer membrane protein n=1 Tax=unclassified Aurantimonas TaxID=2638230 RepID=UPI002E1753CF|nr:MULTISPECIES: outer membrane protein [unclassified Aurantimonas]MEC5410318.1 outer membrane protein [Aurantimonas sp. C2-4-R8]